MRLLFASPSFKAMLGQQGMSDVARDILLLQLREVFAEGAKEAGGSIKCGRRIGTMLLLFAIRFSETASGAAYALLRPSFHLSGDPPPGEPVLVWDRGGRSGGLRGRRRSGGRGGSGRHRSRGHQPKLPSSSLKLIR